MLAHPGMTQVEFDQVVVAVPGLIGERVAIGTLPSETQPREPIPIRRVFAVLLDIPKSPKIAADVVENAIQNQADAVLMQICRQRRQRPPVAEAAVDFGVVGGIVAVRSRFKDRPEIERIDAQTAQVRQPGVDFLQTRAHRAGKVVPLRRAAQPERVNLIKNGVSGPVG